MVSDNNELIMELWARIKSHVQPKERLEVADILVVVFDEFGLVDDSLLDEDLDRELRAAARSHLTEDIDELEGYEDEDDGYGF
jgi:ATP-dependent exoDNAse (exonuclease V) alpha subunit